MKTVQCTVPSKPACAGRNKRSALRRWFNVPRKQSTPQLDWLWSLTPVNALPLAQCPAVIAPHALRTDSDGTLSTMRTGQ